MNKDTTMKLYLISQTENDDWDSFDSAVVCAPDETTAQNMDPATGKQMTTRKWTGSLRAWGTSPDAVTVKYLGEAADTVASGVVCASFNAG